MFRVRMKVLNEIEIRWRNAVKRVNEKLEWLRVEN
jgi:hypothetical protein